MAGYGRADGICKSYLKSENKLNEGSLRHIYMYLVFQSSSLITIRRLANYCIMHPGKNLLQIGHGCRIIGHQICRNYHLFFQSFAFSSEGTHLHLAAFHVHSYMPVKLTLNIFRQPRRVILFACV